MVRYRERFKPFTWKIIDNLEFKYIDEVQEHIDWLRWEEDEL
jgi:hypothetical protein